MAATPEQRRAAADPKTSAVALAQLAAIPDLQLDVAANPGTPDDVIDWLVEPGTAETQAALVGEAGGADPELPHEEIVAPPGPPIRYRSESVPTTTRRRPDGAATSGDLWAEELKYRREKQMTDSELRAQREKERAERDAARDAQELAARANEIKRWEAAWSLAHDGQAPPSGFMPPTAATGYGGYGARPTNPIAIAAFVSAFFIALLGLILGNVALRQIRDSGEGGRGLALAAVALGWIQIAFGAIILIVFLAVRASVGQ